MRLSSSLLLASLVLGQWVDARARVGRTRQLIKDDPLPKPQQNVVTWDEHSLMINGERLMIWSGEFHPFRLPVPSLWIDIFQKVKALGLNTVSFYTHWAQLEGKQGDFSAEGIFAFDEFFKAAQDAGLYLIARPGPYINAEASGGGFPGWLQRISGVLRQNDTQYLDATNNYMANMGGIIADAQITKGGPVILVQPENEYTNAVPGYEPFPNPYYMQYVEDQLRNAGIVVPLISNDASPDGHNVPGSGIGEVDIYGYDSYPLGFDCASPYTWPEGVLPTNFWATHESQSPSTFNSIDEFQGGSFDAPGGPGFANCAILTNNEFERVFYKNNLASGVALMNIYMIFGGTNWGNLGQPGGYASYDYGAAIKEDRTITREKYSELKLEAQFIKVSPGFLLATPSTFTTGIYSSNTGIAVTPDQGPNGSFFIVRHADYTTDTPTTYTLNLPTTAGTLSIPQLGGSLTLNGRDSKIHVTDYPVGGSTVLYSTAEVFTWQRFGHNTVLIVYGEAGELHELAIKDLTKATIVEGSGVTIKAINGSVVAQWTTTTDRRIIQFGSLSVYVLDRNSAYNYWVPELPSSTGQDAVIVNGGYLIRSATVQGNTLALQADFNTTTSIEIIGVPAGVKQLEVNGANIRTSNGAQGSWTGSVAYSTPQFNIPDLSKLDWMTIDSLPEITSSYNDAVWPAANHHYTNNDIWPLNGEPVSLYGSDYGFNVGALLFRGHFKATGTESTFTVGTEGGQAYGASVWLGLTFLGSFVGNADASNGISSFTLPKLTAGQSYIVTILVDNTGLDENWTVGIDEMKLPRGITNYTLSNSGGSTPVTWKLTGNFGGENYADKVRGPLNEGGFFAERQGYHQPNPPLDDFRPGSPLDGITGAGVAFYTAKFTLDLPSSAYDIPLSFTFANSTAAASSGVAFRSLLFVNGYQFGRYTSNIGPQTEFPVPEGILNYGGDNWVALTLWALDAAGASIPDFSLTAGVPVLTGREPVTLVDAPSWSQRPGAY